MNPKNFPTQQLVAVTKYINSLREQNLQEGLPPDSFLEKCIPPLAFKYFNAFLVQWETRNHCRWQLRERFHLNWVQLEVQRQCASVHRRPPSPPSISTNPTASNHYIALFHPCIVPIELQPSWPNQRMEICLLNETDFLQNPQESQVTILSGHLWPLTQEKKKKKILIINLQPVWETSYQTVTDPDPVTQTALGRWFGCWDGTACVTRACVCVCGMERSGFSLTEQKCGDSFTPYTGPQCRFVVWK